MTQDNLMTGFPPRSSDQVTLANWRNAPYSRWAFHHVREVVPTAPVATAKQVTTDVSSNNSDLSGVDIGEGNTLSQLISASHTDSLCILHKGAPVYSWHDSGIDPAAPHIVFSVSKSITAILAGILWDDGLLDPDAPITDYIAEAKGGVYGDCTVRHLLDMTVSIDFDEAYLAKGGNFIRYRQAMGWNPLDEAKDPPDLRSFLLELKSAGETHGEKFHYVSPNSDMLGWVVERAAGTRYADLLGHRLWQPMSASGEAYVTVDRLGAPRSAGGVCCTIRDLALIGELMRQNGSINGQKVVSQDWVKDTTTGGDVDAWKRGDLANFFPGGKYRNKWYQTGSSNGAYCAIGIHGQWIYVDPVREIVIAKQSSQPNPIDDKLDAQWLKAFHQISEQAGTTA